MRILHDQIYKKLIREFFAEFMTMFLPEEAALINFDRVEFLEQEIFSDLPQGYVNVLDLVAKVLLKSGEERFVLVHIEFESQPPQASFPERVFRYFCQLTLRHRAPIVPAGQPHLMSKRLLLPWDLPKKMLAAIDLLS